jgi:hypothetical protein
LRLKKHVKLLLLLLLYQGGKLELKAKAGESHRAQDKTGNDSKWWDGGEERRCVHAEEEGIFDQTSKAEPDDDDFEDHNKNK